MTAARKNLTVDLGTTWTFTFEYRYNGEPVDLTGHTVELRVTKAGDATMQYFSQVVEGTADGRITFEVSDEGTGSWTWRKASYTIDLLEADGNRRGLLWGSFTVRDRADV